MAELQGIKTFEKNLKAYYSSIEKLLSSKYGITPEEFMMSVINSVKRTPKLLNCDPASLFGSILMGAEVGLRPDTPEDFAYLIPYGSTAKYILSYKGIVELMYRSPKIKSVNAYAVYDKDEFEYMLGTDSYVKHRPHRGKNRGRLTATYCVVDLIEGGRVFAVAEGHELDEIKNISPAKEKKDAPRNNGKDIFDWMEIKSAVKKVSKLIPKQHASDMSKAIDYDSQLEGGAIVLAPPINNDSSQVIPSIVEKPKENSLEGSFDNESKDTLSQLNKVKEPQKEVVKTKTETSDNNIKEQKKHVPIENSFDDVDFEDYSDPKKKKEVIKESPKTEDKERKKEPKAKKNSVEPKTHNKPEPKKEKSVSSEEKEPKEKTEKEKNGKGNPFWVNDVEDKDDGQPSLF